MMPNDRWDDFAIDQFVQSVRDYMQATSALPNQMAKLSSAVESNTQRINSHHQWIEAVEQRVNDRLKEVRDLCERIGEELRNDAKERARNRVSIVVAIIGAAGIVAAAIITAPH